MIYIFTLLSGFFSNAGRMVTPSRLDCVDDDDVDDAQRHLIN